MKTKIAKTADFNRLILVSSEELMRHVCQENLSCRQSKIIQDAYHKAWFDEQNGYFYPPSAAIREGRIYFINGRHRTILLSRHLSQFPFQITSIDFDHIGSKPKISSLKVMESIRVCNLEEHSTFILPDLRFGDFDSEADELGIDDDTADLDKPETIIVEQHF